eukprot:SAG11_NODE_4598_length_1840_cov_1.031591_1_plen_306_part_01
MSSRLYAYNPSVIFSYASATDGGKGVEHMWALANVLREAGVTSYCGLMVKTQNWQRMWYGKMRRARAAVVMLSDAYWKSGPCVKELMAILEHGSIRVFIIRVDTTCHTCMRGDFLGNTVDEITDAGFIKAKLSMNCFPPPHEGLFQDAFMGNALEFMSHVQGYLAAVSPAQAQNLNLGHGQAPLPQPLVLAPQTIVTSRCQSVDMFPDKLLDRAVTTAERAEQLQTACASAASAADEATKEAEEAVAAATAARELAQSAPDSCRALQQKATEHDAKSMSILTDANHNLFSAIAEMRLQANTREDLL